MANKNMKHKLNSPGAWYCTDAEDDSGEGCIACNVCYTEAPDFFKEDEDGNAYMIKQPQNAAEEQLCQEQLEACPVASIDKNG
ncbi:MAG: ferredoxin [Bacteroidia bacterium]|jgi:ferredoxin|nr:ferredoxin [Bacteroidia bacterium]